MKVTIKNTHLLLGVLLVLVAGLNVWLLMVAKNQVDFKQLFAHKPKVNVVIINEPSCSDCFDLTQVSEVIAREGGRVKEQVLARGDAAADKLIAQYEIKFLPSFVVTGEIDDPLLEPLWDNFGEKKDEAIVFVKNIPKYYEIATGETFGDFEIIFVTDVSCATCYDVTTHLLALKNLGMQTNNTTTVDISSAEGKALVKKYKITSVPTILLRGELNQYQVFESIWKSVGTIEADGTYVFREPGQKEMGTYKDLKTGNVIPQEIYNEETP